MDARRFHILQELCSKDRQQVTRQDFFKIILDWVAANSGLGREKIIFKDQRGDPPDMPYATIKILSGPKTLGHDQVVPTDTPTSTHQFDVVGQKRFLVELEIYSTLDNQNQD